MGDSSGLTINCSGGLDLISTTEELFRSPGYATSLTNYEISTKGGYRRINGYTRFGSAQPAGNANSILGVYPYADGVIAVQEDSSNQNIYFSEDGITWIQINKQNATLGVDLTTLNSELETTRTSLNRGQFVLYEGNTDYGELVFTDGGNKVAWIKFTGSGISRTYFYAEIATPATATWCEMHKEHLILGHENKVYWSDLFDIVTFTGGSSGELQIANQCAGVKRWRDRLFVFADESIHELVDINSTPFLGDITSKVGCISGFSIQEIGGDVVYLAQDGFRNLAGTEKIDDIELGTISSRIQPIVETLTDDVSSLDISSMVLRDKNQYRLFYTNNVYTDDQQLGLLGVFKLNSATGNLEWQWGQLKNIPLSVAGQRLVSLEDKHYHGGYDGYVYIHDSGNDFNGENILAVYETPEIDYGDLGTKKTLHWIKLSAKTEGTQENLQLKITYDFGDSNTANPLPYSLSTLGEGGSTYGSGDQYGPGGSPQAVYVGPTNKEVRIGVEGSGYSNKFRWSSNGTGAPYNIKNYYVRFYAGKEQ